MKIDDIQIGRDYYIIDETQHTRRARAEEIVHRKKGWPDIIFYIYSREICEKVKLKDVIKKVN